VCVCVYAPPRAAAPTCAIRFGGASATGTPRLGLGRDRFGLPYASSALVFALIMPQEWGSIETRN